VNESCYFAGYVTVSLLYCGKRRDRPRERNFEKYFWGRDRPSTKGSLEKIRERIKFILRNLDHWVLDWLKTKGTLKERKGKKGEH